MSASLVVLPSVAGSEHGGRLHLDRKAVDGLRFYAKFWDGPVHCVMRRSRSGPGNYSAAYQLGELPFRVTLIDRVEQRDGIVRDAGVVLAAGDAFNDLNLPEKTSAPVAFVIENTFTNRLRLLRLEGTPAWQLLKSGAWMTERERVRRRAFRQAAGLQCNGAPSFRAYADLSPAPLLYFDTRAGEAERVRPAALRAKQQQCVEGSPLRLAFSGRLAPLKGSHHLLPIARELEKLGVAFTLDVYGDGPLRASMEEQLRGTSLANKMRLVGPVSFHEVLMPTLGEAADLCLLPHMQSDPSCTYLETLSCGVPIVGYRNEALEGVLALGDVGSSVRAGDPAAAARAVALLDRDRAKLATMMGAAAAVGEEHGLERVMEARVAHLRSLHQGATAARQHRAAG